LGGHASCPLTVIINCNVGIKKMEYKDLEIAIFLIFMRKEMKENKVNTRKDKHYNSENCTIKYCTYIARSYFLSFIKPWFYYFVKYVLLLNYIITMFIPC
jgi:hypothetical protein